MIEDDSLLKYFSDALSARGIASEPWKLEAFAQKKELGQSETEIIEQAECGTRRFESEHLTKRLLVGTAICAIAAPLLDCAISGRSTWAEVGRRSPKTAGVGAGFGAVIGWVESIMHKRATADALENRWAEFKHTTHQMDLAWTEP